LPPRQLAPAKRASRKRLCPHRPRSCGRAHLARSASRRLSSSRRQRPRRQPNQPLRPRSIRVAGRRHHRPSRPQLQKPRRPPRFQLRRSPARRALLRLVKVYPLPDRSPRRRSRSGYNLGQLERSLVLSRDSPSLRPSSHSPRRACRNQASPIHRRHDRRRARRRRRVRHLRRPLPPLKKSRPSAVWPARSRP